MDSVHHREQTDFLRLQLTSADGRHPRSEPRQCNQRLMRHVQTTEGKNHNALLRTESSTRFEERALSATQLRLMHNRNFQESCAGSKQQHQEHHHHHHNAPALAPALAIALVLARDRP